MRLRGDLTFSNGRKATPAAVKHSFDRVLAIRHKLCPSLLFADLEAVEVRGETVVFRLKSDDATWPSKIATGAAAIVDPAEYPADRLREARTAVGSGPYVISSFRPGSSIRLQPRASYRGAAGGKGTSIHIRYFQDAAAPDAAWATEQIDVAHRGLSPKILSGPGPTAHDTRLQAMPTSEIRNLVLDVRPSSPLAKVEVRHAIAALVDRGRLATEVFEDTAEPLYSVIPKGTGHNTAFFDAHPEQDAQRARRLLRSAGVEIPLRFSLGFRDTGPSAAEAKELKRQLEAQGLFAVELVAEPRWTRFQQRYVAGAFDAYTLSWIADFPDPDNFIQPLVGRGNSLSNGYASDGVDRMIRETQRYRDRDAGRDLFWEIQDEVAKDVPLVPLWQRKDHILSRRVSGGEYLSDSAGVWRLWKLDWIWQGAGRLSSIAPCSGVERRSHQPVRACDVIGQHHTATCTLWSPHPPARARPAFPAAALPRPTLPLGDNAQLRPLEPRHAQEFLAHMDRARPHVDTGSASTASPASSTASGSRAPGARPPSSSGRLPAGG